MDNSQITNQVTLTCTTLPAVRHINIKSSLSLECGSRVIPSLSRYITTYLSPIIYFIFYPQSYPADIIGHIYPKEKETKFTLTLTQRSLLILMEAQNQSCCHRHSGTCQHGVESRHSLEGVWVGWYNDSNGGTLQTILVHRLEGKQGYLFGTKLIGDELIGRGHVTFWVRSGDGTDILEGEGQHPGGEYLRICFVFFLKGGRTWSMCC